MAPLLHNACTASNCIRVGSGPKFSSRTPVLHPILIIEILLYLHLYKSSPAPTCNGTTFAQRLHSIQLYQSWLRSQIQLTNTRFTSNFDNRNFAVLALV